MTPAASTTWLADIGLPVASAQGLDVSNYNGAFPWSAQSGLTFGTFRLTQGLGGPGMNSPDPQAGWNHAQIAACGLARGAYHFLDPRLDGAAQARYFSGQYTALGLGPADSMWCDNESAEGCTPAQVSACARAFMATLKALHPHQPMGVYTFIDFAAGGYNSGLGQYPLWLAWPNATAPVAPPPWAVWKFWQWGTRAGTDRDAFNGAAAQFGAWLASFAPPPSPPAPRPAPAPVPPTTGWQETMMRQLPTLAQGSTQAADVRRAQALLGAAGYGLSLDGDFGPDTAAAVRGFQHGHGLSDDGAVGPLTWTFLVTGAAA